MVGGTPVTECGQTYNIRIYKLGCNGLLMPVASAYYEGGTVRTLKWCCNQERPCSPLWYLAVGGDPIKEGPHAGKNIKIYYYQPSRGILKPFAGTSQPDKVFGIDWLQGCNCQDLVAGSGCLARRMCTKYFCLQFGTTTMTVTMILMLLLKNILMTI